MKASIIGATGYSGVELIRLIQQHPIFQLHSIISSTQAGTLFHHVYPHLQHLSIPLEEMNIDKLADEAEIIFFATPPGISSSLVPYLVERGKCVIDLSGDFRLDPMTYEQWYKKPAATSHLDQAVYGLSEWFREEIAGATLISNPGCYPTAALLALAPLLKEKFIEPSSIIIDAKSGVTGAGRSVNQAILFSEVNENLRPYKVDGHQHIPEIERFSSQFAQTAVTVSFVPQLVPMNRGILVTIYASNLNNYTKNDLYNLYLSNYETDAFIRIRDTNWPETKFVQGSNYCDIGFHVDERTGRIIVLAAIDNLMKGAAGQAVQNANIRFDLPETAGLLYSSLYP